MHLSLCTLFQGAGNSLRLLTVGCVGEACRRILTEAGGTNIKLRVGLNQRNLDVFHDKLMQVCPVRSNDYILVCEL
jgi:hypothetical protein